MHFLIEAACGSSVGKVRHNNEDNFLFDGKILPQENQEQLPPLNLSGDFEGDVYMAVFDGMGGMDYGEVASATAAESVRSSIQNGSIMPEDICLQANHAVWQSHAILGTHNVGTTLAMLCFREGRVYAANIGDSRIFKLCGDRLVQISVDHTDEAYMKEHGIVGRNPRLTQYLGMDPGQVRLEPYITKENLQEGDIYLICSDGLTDMVDMEIICQLLTADQTAAACTESLINAALKEGGCDNITVIVCRILEQVKRGRKEYDTSTSQSPVARLGGLGLSWGRKLWRSLQDSTGNFRRN